MIFILGILTAIIQFIVGYLAIFFMAMLGMDLLLESLGQIDPNTVNP